MYPKNQRVSDFLFYNLFIADNFSTQQQSRLNSNIPRSERLKVCSVENDDIVVLIVIVNNPRNVLLINLRAGW